MRNERFFPKKQNDVNLLIYKSFKSILQLQNLKKKDFLAEDFQIVYFQAFDFHYIFELSTKEKK